MAAAKVQSQHRLPIVLFISLLALQCALIENADVVKVIQEPPFASKPNGETLRMTCAINQDYYNIYWYRQLPGQTELHQLGTFPSSTEDLQEKSEGKLKDRLSGKRTNNNASLNLGSLESEDTGLYLCAAKATVTPAGTRLAQNRESDKSMLLTSATDCTCSQLHAQAASFPNTCSQSILYIQAALAKQNHAHSLPRQTNII
ncbi:immunoglobulin iota chain-like [Hemicordylus capensis]|uniref:immunoglobulin iota chain-like n=1 Tax=Hemicordylus capensis TaxID=884348 RepID=UPI002303D215|nr:immunoglobulin iota chain-like [Hemicordylus capensis]